jgi:hypothetical protein
LLNIGLISLSKYLFVYDGRLRGEIVDAISIQEKANPGKMTVEGNQEQIPSDAQQAHNSTIESAF